ncbi:MAG: DNA alkylation repair protein, partial [Treponema sp.]|nr:DNA alkylation repair protein [Treponema sp.]
MKFLQPMTATELFKSFRENANPQQAVAMGAYMRDLFPFLGIPAPERRKLSREFLKAAGKRDVDWGFVFKCWKQPEREFQYLATDYL